MPVLSNEILFLIVALLGMASLPAAAWLGQSWLQGLIIMMTLFLGITDGKVIMVLGLPITLGTALFAVIFVAMDVLNERYGPSVAYRTVRLNIAMALLFQAYLQLTRMAEPATDVQPLSDAMDIVFSTSARIVFAGLLVAWLSQSFDVFLYDRIRRWSGERMLWLRLNGSTLIAQLFDTFAFAFLAFYGVFDGWWQLALVAYGVKMAIAIMGTPFAYAARALARLPG